jgi:hypothetical protein
VKKPLKALLRAATALAAVAALGTVVIGVAHTPWGRPLLRLPLLSALAQHAGCPVGSIEPAAYEKVQATKLRSELGEEPARSRPALGFTLGQTQRAEVERWASANGASCGAGFVVSVLECQTLKAAGSGGRELPPAHVRLQFDANQQLISVDVFRDQGDAPTLVNAFVATGQALDQQVGPATSSVGTPSVAAATSSPFRTLLRQYSYRDYVARLTLLNLGKRGLRLREQYSFVPPPA